MRLQIRNSSRAPRPAEDIHEERRLQQVRRIVRRHPVATVFLVALAVRVSLSVVIYALYGGAVFGDDLTYPRMAEMAASGESAVWDDFTRTLYWSTAALTVPLTLLFKLFGPVLLVGQLFVSVFGALAAALVARLVLVALPVRWALFSGGVTAFLPSQVLWSSLTLKDALVWSALVGIAVVVAMTKGADMRRMVILAGTAALLLGALGFLRDHTLVVAAVALAIASWLGAADRRVARGVGGLVVATVVPLALGLGPMGLGFAVSNADTVDQRRAANADNAATAFVSNQEGVSDPEILAAERDAANAGAVATRLRQELEQRGRDEGQGLANDSPEIRALMEQLEAAEQEGERARARAESMKTERLDESFGDTGTGGAEHSLQHLPKGLAVMLLYPYPWQSYENDRVQIVRVEMALWYPLLAFAVVGAVSALRRWPHVLLFPLLAGGGIAVMYGLVEGNFGTAFRHRGEFVWVVAAFAAFGLHQVVHRLRHRESTES